MKNRLNSKIVEVLKEDFEPSTINQPNEDGTVSIAKAIQTNDGGNVDLFFSLANKEVMEVKTQNGTSSLNFIPLSEFKPDVYGLSSDVFDKVEQNNSLTDTSQQIIGSEESNEENNNYDPAYEENYGFEQGKSLAAIEDSPTDVTVADFNDIEDDTLLEFAYSKGVDFTTRNKTIKTLFEHNKVTKKELDTLKEFIKKSKLNEEVALLEEDNFIDKFGSDLDFRYREGQFVIDSISSPEIYNMLNDLSQEDWEKYNSELNATNVTVSYDPTEDAFIFIGNEEDINNEELYDIDNEDKTIIENIIKTTSYTLKEIKGFPKSTGKSYMLEIVVEKDGRDTSILYNDNKNVRPWSIKNTEFNTLKESLNSIYVPYKSLIKETVESNKRKGHRNNVMLEEIRKESWNKTKNLPLAEKEIRETRSLTLIKSMFKESKENDVDSYLTELKKINEKYND